MTGKITRAAAGGILGLAMVSPAIAFDKFDGVQFMSAMVRDHSMEDRNAMALTDARMLARLHQIGVELDYLPHQEIMWQRLNETSAFWGTKTLIRLPYSPEVIDEEGNVLFRLGPIEDPERNLFDHGHAEKRQLAAEAMGRTVASLTSDWVMIDEPFWSYRGMEDARQLPISQALSDLVRERTGRPIESVDAFEEDPEVWHAFVYERQRALAKSLTMFSEAAREAGKKMAINVFPAAMESGAVTGFEIATAMDVFGNNIDQIGIDPYYTLFVEDPRYAGFMLRILDDSTPRDMPMMGWIDGVNGLLERLALKNPPPESMKPQIATYLANGSDHLAVWAHSYLESMGNREAYQEMVRWVRDNQALYSGNPEMVSDTGLYYSNLTVAMNDYFPIGWTHGTGPFGQYFTALNTYYMATVTHVPVRVLSTPLGHEYRLAEKLERLRRLIVADATVMSDPEIDVIEEWVRTGGELIVIGDSGKLDAFKQPREAGLNRISGIALTEVKPRSSLRFTEEWPRSGENALAVEINGSNEWLFIDRYQDNRAYALNPDHDERARYFPERWPLHLRSTPLEPTRKLEDPQYSDWSPGGAPGLEVGEDAVVLARYDDGDAAIAEVAVGEGRVIHVAPSDWLTRYRDPVARQAARNLFHDVLQPEFVLSGADEADLASLELVVTERRHGDRRGIMVHLVRHIHDDQAIIPSGETLRDITVELTLDPGETVQFVTPFSPDTETLKLHHSQNDRTLKITFETMDVYNAALIGTGRQAEHSLTGKFQP